MQRSKPDERSSLSFFFIGKMAGRVLEDHGGRSGFLAAFEINKIFFNPEGNNQLLSLMIKENS